MGGDRTDVFDCSGLVLRAWEAAGVALPRVAADQFDAGEHLPGRRRDGGPPVLRPDPSDPTTIDHVGIYLGGGRMVEAPHTGADVRVVDVYSEGSSLRSPGLGMRARTALRRPAGPSSTVTDPGAQAGQRRHLGPAGSPVKPASGA